ncbi:uncharacterized protein [Lepeophtheirus salmonis]|uniref:uncharacterized protein isoform X2 n=1 Tax=Lepeophtheirus salmonis TaxID=72036 RepID=UPI003AF3F06F
MKFHCFTILTFVSINYTFSHIQLNDSVELSDKCLVKIFQEHHAYICDSRRNQNCFNGRYDDDKHCMNPSVAFFKNKDCYNENCLMPNSSFCNSGWKGIACSLCIPLPGCQHGICKKPYECICKKGYQGVLCNKPQCDNCKHGRCIEPNKCFCDFGWKGNNCDECKLFPNCKNGTCFHTFECNCNEGFKGLFCNISVSKITKSASHQILIFSSRRINVNTIVFNFQRLLDHV